MNYSAGYETDKESAPRLCRSVVQSFSDANFKHMYQWLTNVFVDNLVSDFVCQAFIEVPKTPCLKRLKRNRVPLGKNSMILKMIPTALFWTNAFVEKRAVEIIFDIS